MRFFPGDRVEFHSGCEGVIVRDCGDGRYDVDRTDFMGRTKRWYGFDGSQLRLNERVGSSYVYDFYWRSSDPSTPDVPYIRSQASEELRTGTTPTQALARLVKDSYNALPKSTDWIVVNTSTGLAQTFRTAYVVPEPVEPTLKVEAI